MVCRRGTPHNNYCYSPSTLTVGTCQTERYAILDAFACAQARMSSRNLLRSFKWPWMGHEAHVHLACALLALTISTITCCFVLQSSTADRHAGKETAIVSRAGSSTRGREALAPVTGVR